MYFGAFQRGLGYLREMLGGLADLYENNLFLSNLYEFLDLEPKVKEPIHPVPVPRPMKKGISFEHVSFKYPTNNHKVLEDVSLSIEPRERGKDIEQRGRQFCNHLKSNERLYFLLFEPPKVYVL